MIHVYENHIPLNLLVRPYPPSIRSLPWIWMFSLLILRSYTFSCLFICFFCSRLTVSYFFDCLITLIRKSTSPPLSEERLKRFRIVGLEPISFSILYSVLAIYSMSLTLMDPPRKKEWMRLWRLRAGFQVLTTIWWKPAVRGISQKPYPSILFLPQPSIELTCRYMIGHRCLTQLILVTTCQSNGNEKLYAVVWLSFFSRTSCGDTACVKDSLSRNWVN